MCGVGRRGRSLGTRGLRRGLCDLDDVSVFTGRIWMGAVSGCIRDWGRRYGRARGNVKCRN